VTLMPLRGDNTISIQIAALPSSGIRLTLGSTTTTRADGDLPVMADL